MLISAERIRHLPAPLINNCIRGAFFLRAVVRLPAFLGRRSTHDRKKGQREWLFYRLNHAEICGPGILRHIIKQDHPACPRQLSERDLVRKGMVAGGQDISHAFLPFRFQHVFLPVYEAKPNLRISQTMGKPPHEPIHHVVERKVGRKYPGGKPGDGRQVPAVERQLLRPLFRFLHTLMKLLRPLLEQCLKHGVFFLQLPSHLIEGKPEFLKFVPRAQGDLVRQFSLADTIGAIMKDRERSEDHRSDGDRDDASEHNNKHTGEHHQLQFV